MSDITMTKCDQCKKRTDDAYDELGWVTLDQFGSISIAKGRAKDSTAKSRYHNAQGKRLDFCGRKCLLAWIDGLK